MIKPLGRKYVIRIFPKYLPKGVNPGQSAQAVNSRIPIIYDGKR
jgi:hypothetical protein